MGTLIILKSLVVLSICVIQLAAECDYAWNDAPCRSGLSEVYRDVDRYNQGVTRFCCTRGSEEFKDQIKAQSSCRRTQCLSGTLDDTCDWLDYRYVNNTELKYEEILHDTCEHPQHTNNQETGKLALCCIKDSPTGYVVSITGAEPHEFPHQAQLVLGGGTCGGTIYNKRWILTAGHCLVGPGEEVNVGPDWHVVLGTNIALDETPSRQYKVKRALAHENFGFLKTGKEFQERRAKNLPDRMVNDIALLELDREIQFSENVKALQISEADFDPREYSDIAMIVGWGVTELGEGADFLHKENVPFRDECLKYYYGPTPKKYQDRVLCVSGITKKSFSIAGGQGDSGGPLVCRGKDGHPRQCGVTSMGGNKKECVKKLDADHCTPPVYTKVAYYRNWIEEHAGKQDPKTFFRGYLYGKKVKGSEVPHQVHITSNGGKSCGGTLIRPDVVVTAAQCVADGAGKNYEDIKVTARLNDVSGEGKEYGVEAVKTIPGFRRTGSKVDLKKQGTRIIQTDNYFVEDLALIKLDRKAIRNADNLPKLPGKKDKFENGVEFAFPRDTSKGGEMRSRDYKILKKSACQRKMNRLRLAGLNLRVSDDMLCGIEKYSGGSTCDRELGGGLICKGEDGNNVLCGVQIFRLCEFALPNGFLNVARFSDWINEEIEKF